MITLWSKRFTIARGWEWKHERVCSEEGASQWLAVFKHAEPAVEFKLSKIKPRS